MFNIKNRMHRMERRAILQLALPIVVGQLCLIGMEITDSFMAARLGTVALSAVSTASSTTYPIFLAIMGVASVLSPTIARYKAQGATDKMGADMRIMLCLALVLALPLFLYLDNGQSALQLFKISPDIIAPAASYMAFRKWGIFPLIFFAVLRYFYEGIGETKPFMRALLIAFFLNIPLNYAFIHGVGGLPPMGVAGIGLSTAVVDFLMAIILVISTCQTPLKRYRLWQPCWRIDWSRMQAFLSLGIPAGFLVLGEVGFFAIIGILLAQISPVQAAAHQIVLNVTALSFMVSFSISSAAAARIGYHEGKLKRDRSILSIRILVRLILGVTIVSSLMILVFHRHIPLLYHAGPILFRHTTTVLVICGFMQIADGFQVLLTGILRGLNNTFYPMCVTLICYWGLGLPVGYVLSQHLDSPVLGYWSTLFGVLTLAWALHALTLYFVLRKRTE